MKIISIFIIISILIATIISSSVQPKLHKHFLIAPANFNLSSLNDLADDTQSVTLFKIGNVNPINSVFQEQIVSQEEILVPEDVTIIPSSFIDTVSFNDVKQTGNGSEISSNTRPQEEAVSPSQDNSNEVLEQVENMLNNELDKAVEKQPETSREVKPGATCSICDKLKDPKYREELIAWNSWRSKIQNWIMQHSNVTEADMGTIFYFTFSVDKYRNVKNIKVFCTNRNYVGDIKQVRSTIMSLKGKPILEFPEGSNRERIDFGGGFLIGPYSQFSSPSDFNDVERVLRSY